MKLHPPSKRGRRGRRAHDTLGDVRQRRGYLLLLLLRWTIWVNPPVARACYSECSWHSEKWHNVSCLVVNNNTCVRCVASFVSVCCNFCIAQRGTGICTVPYADVSRWVICVLFGGRDIRLNGVIDCGGGERGRELSVGFKFVPGLGTFGRREGCLGFLFLRSFINFGGWGESKEYGLIDRVYSFVL